MTESENIMHSILNNNNLLTIVENLLKHKRLYQYREISFNGDIAKYIFLGIILIFFYGLIYVSIPEENVYFFALVVLLLDFVLKFLFKDVYVNILPYLVIPFKKNIDKIYFINR